MYKTHIVTTGFTRAHLRNELMRICHFSCLIMARYYTSTHTQKYTHTLTLKHTYIRTHAYSLTHTISLSHPKSTHTRGHVLSGRTPVT